MLHKAIEKRWGGATVFVAATGPSLTPEVASLVRGNRVVAVNDAYKLFPFADVLYACDAKWWDVHKGCPGFLGERWSSHEKGGSNDKREAGAKYGLKLVAGRSGETFRTDGAIAYGSNSGFQAVNLAILFGASRIVLVGFDMREVGGRRHFFGEHPRPLRSGGCFQSWAAKFASAAKCLPAGVQVVNATPGSAVKAFPFVKLDDECASLK
jgi:hypothetical protein